jgi:hypothetical protein
VGDDSFVTTSHPDGPADGQRSDAVTTPSAPDAEADVVDVSGADPSVTSGRGADVGARSLEEGDASQVPGLVVDDPEDVDQVAAIPPMPGVSFRSGAADWWEVGSTYLEPGWLRTSRDPLVGTANFAGDAVVVFGRTGRDIAGLTPHPEEQETVFLPGSRFTVVRTGDLDGTWVTLVRVAGEDGRDTPDDVDDLARRAGAVLARARTLPGVEIARPGRFSGSFGRRAD